ncbi:hypothetical protein JZ751_015164 [Albula glossodonta]|uniref:Uncharacterized protein n=1 Tax=Albula glossodonta TaxID=121402 RepID=A0A8T2NZW7_9TELE|nr:hypothetical protein JZ751_015164 [Albula glossodonta]
MSEIATLDMNEHSTVCRSVPPSTRPPSPSPSVSLLEIKEDTHMVLRAFLRHAVSIPSEKRPGRVGGAYRNPHMFSASAVHHKGTDGRESLDEQTSSDDEKKSKLKDFMKKHLKSGLSQKDSVKMDGKHQADVVSPYSSTSEEGSGGEEGRKKKNKKFKSKLSTLIRKMKLSRKDGSNNDQHPKRSVSLASGDRKTDAEEAVTSPGHSPNFYEEVAETLERIAQKHSVKRRDPSPASSPTPSDKEVLVQQLVKTLQVQGDAIDHKIQSDPFLRSSLIRLSYASFASLVDKFTNQVEVTGPAPEGSTLARMAVSMEVRISCDQRMFWSMTDRHVCVFYQADQQINGQETKAPRGPSSSVVLNTKGECVKCKLTEH